MSKAKELAREIKQTDFSFMDRKKIVTIAEELANAVLSEPEPELEGWIEVTLDASNKKMFANLAQVECFIECSDRITNLVLTGDRGNMVVKESYDEIKQLIKGAS